LLILFCIVQFLCISTGPTGLFLNLTGNDKFLKNNIYVGLFISLSIGLLLIKSYGIYGMLASYCCGVIFENFKSLFTVKNYLNSNEGIST
jgi:O-antigen/teichoic acid export membrane protein